MMRSEQSELDPPARPPVPLLPRRGGAVHRWAAEEREALMQISAAAADAYRLEDVMEQAAEAALEVTGAASLSISRWERERGVMRTLINVGQLARHEERFPDDECYSLEDNPQVAQLLLEAEPYFTAVDDADAPPAAVELLRSHGKDSDLAVPIVLDGEVWGEVWAATVAGSRRFDAGDVRFLQAIADRLALVLARVERFTKVSRLAYEDPLTGLANRRAIEERLEALLGSAPTLRDLTLLLCDVDGLKDVNDAHGHHAGDRALCRVADALTAAAAPMTAALVGRLGGDEFCVLLAGCGAEAASEVAATALALLAEQGELPLSLSFGAASALPAMTTPELLKAADAAQYAAKRRGGGRLCTAGVEAALEAVDGRGAGSPRGVEQRLERTAAEMVRMLDTDLVHQPSLDRIEAVAGGLAGALNAAAWAVSTWEHGSTTLHTRSTADDRASRLRGVRMGLDHQAYDLADFPRTAQALRDGHGGFLARIEDQDCDAAERGLLAELGFSAALVAATRYGSESYLLEIYADGHSADLAPAMTRVQLVLRLAAAPRDAS